VVRDVGLTFDFILRPPELPAALATVRAFPDMSFVIDQVDKAPNVPSELEVWAGLLEPFRGLANVSGKLCGLITSAGWTDWAPDRLQPFVHRALDIFGADRLIFGSDWPVSLLAGQYAVVKQALEDALPPLPPAEWTKIFGGNAIDRYRLELPLLAAKGA
jgi:L-fuconolactonase